MSNVKPYLERLAAEALPDGGWGYAPNQPFHPEPTCLGLLALSLDAECYRAVMERGRSSLERSMAPEGTFRLARGPEEALWPTALALYVQAALQESPEVLQRTAAAVLSYRSRVPEDPGAAEMHDIDIHIVGWPWALDNFAWVEPTAWACLALRRAGFGSDPRVHEGVRLLLDRANDTGGINYGNRHVFGRLTEPIPGPTALMLLALQGHGDHPRIQAAIRYLQREIETDDDLEHLCWAKLALDVMASPVASAPGATASRVASAPGALSSLDERIEAAHQARTAATWLRQSHLRDALTALALATEQRNVFRLNNESRDAKTGSHGDTETQRAASKAGPIPVSLSPCFPVSMSSSKRSWTHRLKSLVRGVGVEAAGRLRQVPSPSRVHIATVTDYNADLAGILQRQYEGFRERVPLAGKRVVLKPNIVEYHRDKVINTHPHVIAAAIELCRREGATDIIVAEGPGHCRNVEHLVTASGLGDVLRHHQVSFVDLNHDEPVKRINLGRLTKLDYLFMAETVTTADVLISLPKLKTHHWAGATLSLKNLFGMLPGICYGWPKNELHWRGLENSIVDIALTRPPDLAIVDGIVGMEGDGPLNGTPKPLGALIMGTDPLAVDATCCRLMMLNPEHVGYLVLGYQKKLGLLHEREIEQVGERINGLARPFETLPHFHSLYMGRSA